MAGLFFIHRWRSRQGGSVGGLQWVVGLVVTFTAQHAWSQDAALLSEAIAEYSAAMELTDRAARVEKFGRAEQLFRQAMEGANPSAQLLVNLGNAALQAEHLGSAIVSYRRALLADPNHKQAQQNLEHARSIVPQWARHDRSASVMDTLIFWTGWVSPTVAMLLAAVVFFVFGAMFAYRARRQTAMGWMWILPVISLLILGSSWLGSGDESAQVVVIVSADAQLFAADSENAPLRMKAPLPDGAELRIVQERDAWLEVEILGQPDRRGWIKASTAERLSRP